MGRLWVVFFFWGYVGICLLVSVSCAENDDKGQIGDTRYICTNGVPTLGGSANNGEERCSVCDDGYHLSGRAGAEHTACEANAYVCTNGMPTFGGSANSGEERCSVCDDGYHLSGRAGAEHTACEANTYVCTNGMPMFERPRVNEQEGCISCNNRFTLTTTNRCAVHDTIGFTCVEDSDCGGGLYCDDTIHDDDPKSYQCEPLKGEGELCGKNVRNPHNSLSRVCQVGLQCNDIDGVNGICTTEELGALCSHNGLYAASGLIYYRPVPNAGHHCKRGLYCDLPNVRSPGNHPIGECKVDLNDQGETAATADELSPFGGTVNGARHVFDVDYFIINIPSTGRLDVHLSIPGSTGIKLSGGIQLRGTSGWINTTLFSGGSTIVSRLFSIPVNQSSAYYIRIDGEDRLFPLGLYDYKLVAFLDQHSDTRSGALMITDGSTTSASLSSSGDIDYFAINVPSGKILHAYTTGSASVNTVGDIENSSGVLLVSDDNGGDHSHFFVSYNALASGTYYIKVTGRGHRFGNYSLVASLDQHSDTLSDATRVITGSTTQGNLFLGDEDYFVINVPSNKILRAYITGSTGIIGDVQDSSGTTLVDDNDGNFDVSYTVANAGDYYIWVRKPYGSSNSNIQAYNLQVSVDNAPMINDNHGDTVSDATMINMASTAGSMSETSGTLHIGDTDYFLLDVTPPALASILFVCVYTTDAAGMMGIPIRVGTSRGVGVTLSNGAANASTFTYLPGIPRSIAVWSTATGDYRLHVKIGNCPP